VAVCCSSASVRSRLRASSSLKETDVLDGDDGLVGEGLQQLDLGLGEWLNLTPCHGDCPYGLLVTQHRDSDIRSKPRRRCDGRRELLAVGLIVDMDHRA
jgi:hypothetical protein